MIAKEMVRDFLVPSLKSQNESAFEAKTLGAPEGCTGKMLKPKSLAPDHATQYEESPVSLIIFSSLSDFSLTIKALNAELSWTLKLSLLNGKDITVIKQISNTVNVAFCFEKYVFTIEALDRKRIKQVKVTRNA